MTSWKNLVATIGVAALVVVPTASAASTGQHGNLGRPGLPGAASASSGVIGGIDYGPLVGLIGTWKSAPNGGVDVAPGQAGSKGGKGKASVTPYYETITYTPAGGAGNASEQHLAAPYY